MARPSSDIDPRKVDTPSPRKRRRKDRKRPDPHPALEADRLAAIERAEARPPSVAVMLERKGDRWVFTPPHNDTGLWELQLADAFATRSSAVMETFLRDLKSLCRSDYDDAAQAWKVNETELSAALAIVKDIEPQSIREAALAAQMVAVHWMTMRLSKDALNSGGMVMEKQASIAARLARTYAEQMNTLRLERGGAAAPIRQEIHVTKETHITYHDNRGGGSDAGQSDATDGEGMQPARVIGDRQALSGPDEINGAVVPFSRSQGPERVSNARRQGRCTQGKA